MQVRHMSKTRRNYLFINAFIYLYLFINIYFSSTCAVKLNEFFLSITAMFSRFDNVVLHFHTKDQ